MQTRSCSGAPTTRASIPSGPVSRNEHTTRTRDLGRWLDATHKVVVSHTLTDAPWENSSITRDLGGEIERLRRADGRDVLVSNSASIIAELLRLDLIDDLQLAVVPVLVGGGLRLFPDGVAARFQTVGVSVLEHGAVGLHLRRP